MNMAGPPIAVAKTCSIGRAALSHSTVTGVAPCRSTASGAQD